MLVARRLKPRRARIDDLDEANGAAVVLRDRLLEREIAAFHL
jgi:hypothetical protein